MLYTLRAGRINTLLFMAPDIPVFKIQSDLLPRFRNTPFNYFQSFYPITKRNEKLLSPSSKTPIRTINRDESTRSKRERQLFHSKTRSYRDQAYLTNKNKEEEEKKERIMHAHLDSFLVAVLVSLRPLFLPAPRLGPTGTRADRPDSSAGQQAS